ncbi:MAG: hypothetical protein LC792_03045 [Actinobacteria bacterium]|nr:hypothetical protein [Actinomycetota bacterium]
MATTSDLIAHTRRLMMASGRQETNRLTSTISNSATTLDIDFAAGSIAKDAVLSIDLELLYVWSITGSTVTVQRGVNGSTAATHSAGALIYVNPVVPDFHVFSALNDELASLSGPLYRVKTVTATASIASTYNLAADVERILAVQYNAVGPSVDWPRLRRWDLLQNQDTSVFASGRAIQLYEMPMPGRTLRVTYAADLGTLATLTDDVQTATGLPASANDIPPLGAAGRLLTGREARRSSIDAQPESRQAADVPPGTARSGAAQLFALRDRRLREEAGKLTREWPSMMRPAV